MTDTDSHPSGKLIRLHHGDEKKLGLDEIVAENCRFHMERLSDGEIWFGVYFGNERLSGQLQADAKGKLSAIVEREEA
jgi:hypothetical protein